jgi:hypothetical protein
MSKIDDVARGLLIDAFITYVAICREKGYGTEGILAWSDELANMKERVTFVGPTREMQIASALDGRPVEDEYVESLIEERRGLIRDTMREEMADLETAGPSPEDVEGISDERQG